MKRTKKISGLTQTKTFLKRELLNLGLIAFAVVFGATTIAGSVHADVTHPTEAEKKATALMVSAMTNELSDYGSLPLSGKRQIPRKLSVTTTAYSSELSQTDATPFVTASGTTVRHGVVAANFLPIGTKIKIPALYGDETFVVEDRMNARYAERLDIWMETRGEAKTFGVRRLEIEIDE